MRARLAMAMVLCLVALGMAALAVSACGSTSDTEGAATAEPDTEGTVTAEVTGVSGITSFEEASSGQLEHLLYGGTVTVEFPEGTTVEAACSEELAVSLEGCPEFSADGDVGGFAAEIEISIDPGQEVRVQESETGEWEVVSLAD